MLLIIRLFCLINTYRSALNSRPGPVTIFFKLDHGLVNTISIRKRVVYWFGLKFVLDRFKLYFFKKEINERIFFLENLTSES